MTKDAQDSDTQPLRVDIEDDDGISHIPTLPQYPPNDGSQTYRLIRKSRLAIDGGSFSKALAYSGTAIEEAKRENLPTLECAALCMHAIETSSTGMFSEALSLAQTALQLATSLDDKALEARAYGAIAYVALETHDEAEAIKVLERALACANLSNSAYDQFWSLNNLAHAYQDQSVRHLEEGDAAKHTIALTRSITYATNALDVARRSGVWLQRSFALLNLVSSEISRGNLKEAKTLVDQYTEIASAKNQIRVLAFGNLDYARIFAATGQFKEAIACLDTTEHFEQLCVTDDLLLRSHDALAIYHKSLRDLDSVVKHLEAARTLEKRIQAAQADRHIRALSAKLDIEDARAEAKLQRANAEALEARNALLERDREDLERRAMLDALTGLGNRRAADQDLERRLRAAQEHGAIFSVTYLDLDHFKSINDRFGHHIGDVVLEQVSQILLGNLRGQDRVFRYGGEEFILLVSEQIEPQSGEICNRLRKAIATYDWSEVHPDLTVTASFGVSTWTADTDGPLIIKRADNALYRAKTSGRNQVVVF